MRNLPFGIGSAQTCRSICWVVPCLGSSHSTVVSSGFLYPNFSHYPRERAVGIFLFKGEYTTIDLNSVLQVGGLKYHKDFVFAVASADTACRFGQGIAQFIRLADLLPAFNRALHVMTCKPRFLKRDLSGGDPATPVRGPAPA